MSQTHELKVTPDEIEMPDAPTKSIKVVKYKRPDEIAAKLLVPLAHSDIMFCAVQVLRDGGENNLHSHAAMDGLWFVLSGKVRFYGKDHEVIGEFGKHEGVFIPRDVPYWFESVGDEVLELLQVEARDPNTKNSYRRLRKSETPLKVGIYKPEGDFVLETEVDLEARNNQ